MKNLKNKTAIITGGSKGIGKGIVEKFAKDGCNVAFTYLSSESSANEVEEKAKSHGVKVIKYKSCLLYTSPSPRDVRSSRMPSSA